MTASLLPSAKLNFLPLRFLQSWNQNGAPSCRGSCAFSFFSNLLRLEALQDREQFFADARKKTTGQMSDSEINFSARKESE